MKTIYSEAFKNCNKLKSVTFSGNSQLTSIGTGTFSNCSSLTNIIIPKNVANIGKDAFSYCNSLTIYCEAVSKPDEWNSNWNSSNRPVYWYRETQPISSGNYWHYNTDGATPLQW